MEIIFEPLDFAYLMTSRTSAVSPDWETVMSTESLPRKFPYLHMNSEEGVKWVIFPETFENMYSPNKHTFEAVPQPVRKMFFAFFSWMMAFLRFPFCFNAFRIDFFCSKISFIMKCW